MMIENHKMMFGIPCAEIYVDVKTGKIKDYNDDFLTIVGIDPNKANMKDLNVKDVLDNPERFELKDIYKERINNPGNHNGICYLHRLRRPDGKNVAAIGITKLTEDKDIAKTTIIDVSDFYDMAAPSQDKEDAGESESFAFFKFDKEDFDNDGYIYCSKNNIDDDSKGSFEKLYIHESDKEHFFEIMKNACIDTEVSSDTVDFSASVDNNAYRRYRAEFYAVSKNGSSKARSIVGKLLPIDGEICQDRLTINRVTSIDSLTGLINFNRFKTAASAYIETRDKSLSLAIIYFDINNFAYINENFGFAAGNQILCDTARLIKNNENVIAASRIHSDFFVAAIEGPTEDAVIQKMNKLGRLFSILHTRKYPINDINLTAGIYFLKPEDTNVRIAIDNANIARRSIKGNRQQWLCVFDEKIKARRLAEQEVRTKIHQAIEDGEIEAFLQPKFSFRRMEIIGAEALARWRNPDGTYKQPYLFVPMLEKAGYIIDLDFEIYRQVLALIKQWQQDGLEPLPISVNFSRVHNNYKNFVNRVEEMTTEYGVDPKYVEIEITESIIAKDPETVINNMNAFADFGFRIDMDDFGTGYSSLSFLRDAPIDTVKVDKTFVDQVLRSHKDKEYVKQLCKLIETTGKDVLFEGVENIEQAEFFKSCGFDMAQGWLFDKAIPIADFNKKYMYK